MTCFSVRNVFASPTDGTIDPNNVGNQYAWSDNAGWINFGTGVGAGDIHITNAGITGYAWSQNFGWINMNPAGSGVIIDPDGNLSGSAWGENTGYIDFSNAFIDSSGLFGGTATGPVVGTLAFNCPNCVVETDYRPENAQSGGGRRRVVSLPQEVLAGPADVKEDSSSADADRNDREFIYHPAGPMVPGKEALLDLLVALQNLYGWMQPENSEFLARSQSKANYFQNFFMKRAFHRLIGVEYLSRNEAFAYDFEYRLNVEEPIEIAVDLMKSVFLNFGPVCYDSIMLQFAEEIDYPKSPNWYERYAFIMKPWMDDVLGLEDYVLWKDVQKIDLLKSLQSFLLDHCSNPHPFSEFTN